MWPLKPSPEFGLGWREDVPAVDTPANNPVEAMRPLPSSSYRTAWER